MAVTKRFERILGRCKVGRTSDKTMPVPTGHKPSHNTANEGDEVNAVRKSSWSRLFTQTRLKRIIPNSIRHFTKSQRLTCSDPGLDVLRSAVLAQRDTESTQHELCTRLDTLDSKVEYLDSKIRVLEERVETLTLEAKSGFEARVAKARDAIEMVRNASYELQERRGAVFEELLAARAREHTDVPRLLKVIEDVLVQNGIIHSREAISDSSKGMSESTTQIASHVDKSVTGTKSEGRAQRGPVLRRSAGSKDLRRMASNSPPSSHESVDEFVLGPKEQAEWDYRARKVFLAQWEKDFEDREARFDQEHYELLRGQATGSRNTAISELDRRHILETRRLAQALTRAEEDFYAAKEAAVRAGVDLGSEAESGFVSRSDDGYSLSLEIDEEMDVDRERIMKWLEGLPEVRPGDVARAEAIDREAAALADERTQNDDDSFDLDSVNLCDTRSAIAEGPWRRRIDKWNSMKPQACGAKIGDARAAE